MVSVLFYSNGEYNEPYPGKAERNMLIYSADMTSSTYNINKTENFYCIGKADSQRI